MNQPTKIAHIAQTDIIQSCDDDMIKWVIAAVLVGVISEAAGGSNWAVIVAGSRGFWNYRHQVSSGVS